MRILQLVLAPSNAPPAARVTLYPPSDAPIVVRDRQRRTDGLFARLHRHERGRPFPQLIYPSTDVTTRAPPTYVPQRLDKLPYGRHRRWREQILGA